MNIKKRLNDIKTNQNYGENEQNNFNQNKIDNNKDYINTSIKLAKDFLNYNKLFSSKIYSNIDKSLQITKNNNLTHSNYIKYDVINDYLNKNYKTQINYHPNYNYNIPSTELNISQDKNKYNNEGNSKYNKINNYNTIETNNNTLNNNKDTYNIETNKNYNKEDKTILFETNLKILNIQLENKENKIKSLESNINYLNKENQNLKEYINKLESSIQTINNNDLFSDNGQNIFNNENNNNLSNEIDVKNNQIQTLINKENISTIIDNNTISNIEKIMNTINYFIKKCLLSII